jgi:hypothetical protein
MFCPGCGFEELQRSHFCRACGADLRPARTGLEKIETLSSADLDAREEIGRALADKIREMQKTKDLETLVESVLPEVEKFLESPEERRLRRIRAGVITSALGIAAMACVFLLAFFTRTRELLPLMGIGVVPFLIGLGIIINGFLFSLPGKGIMRQSSRSLEKLLDQIPTRPRAAIKPPTATIQSTSAPAPVLPSVTEHTTHHLADEVSVPRVVRE